MENYDDKQRELLPGVTTSMTMHGGRVAAHSAGIDCGSRFTVTLPLLSSGGVENSRAPSHARGNGGRRPGCC